MIKHIALIALLCLSSSSTFASYIYANDFSVGSDTTHLTDNATLSWLSSEDGLSGSSVSDHSWMPNQHFGGASSAATWDSGMSQYVNLMYGSNQPSYQALQLDFLAPVRSFGMKVESDSGDGFGVYVFDPLGNFVEAMRVYQSTTFLYPDTREGTYHNGSYHWDFDYDVGQIRVGSTMAAGYVYALDIAEVPEPSSLILLGLGLLCILKSRSSFNFSSLKLKAA
ncbi:MAG: PEP-CTERM sorting domain-containing protein [Gammaproteobacteria bacterium]|nr:MAG: PEP-CTERM sorting domain-containing protein [Gammaproteobacteria bacterium]